MVNLFKILELPLKGNFIPYPSRSGVEVGSYAPDFTLPDVHGQSFTLSNLEPKWTFLYLTRIVDRGFI
jgi:cytochrome oxidase Cu insertion factor (SCO1/SenC/PrrC family)